MDIILTLSILGVSVYTDWKEYKIYNKPLLFCFIFGVLYHTYINGFIGFQTSIVAGLAGLFFLLPGYVLGALGAGDVKLYGTISALMGVPFLIKMSSWLIIYCAVWSIIALLINKRVTESLKWTGEYIIYVFTKALTVGIKNPEKPIVQEGTKIKFAFVITAAALTTMIYKGGIF